MVIPEKVTKPKKPFYHRYFSCEQKLTGHLGSRKLFLPRVRRLLPALLWHPGVTGSTLTQICGCSHFPFHFTLPGFSINRLLVKKLWIIPFVQQHSATFTIRSSPPCVNVLPLIYMLRCISLCLKRSTVT